LTSETKLERFAAAQGKTVTKPTFLEARSNAMGIAALDPSYNSSLSARAGKGVKKMFTRICLLGILSMLLLVVLAIEGFSAAAKDPEEIW
jgi:hypothetical protein